MTLQHVYILFQIIAFIFAISVHESAHAWMANLRGDPTARMLGRITLNPIKHIDPVGTVLLPLIAALTHVPLLGWAKPTPVNPTNFRYPVLDDILTSVVGPVSNLAVAARYVFRPNIFEWLTRTPPGKGGEIQLTDAIRLLLKNGGKVLGMQLAPGERRFDIGNFESYFQAFIEFALADPRHGTELREFVRKLVG